MKTITTLLCFIFGLSLHAQEYVFSVSNEPYQDLTNSISINDGEIWDDPIFIIPIGFDFQIGTHSYDTLSIGGQGGSLMTGIGDGQGIQAMISPFMQDILDLGIFTEVSQSNLSYKLAGTPGSRILKIEWNHVGFWGDSSLDDFMNFQVWLYEGSNIVAIHYGLNAVNNLQSFEGFTGPKVLFAPAFNMGTETILTTFYFFTGDPINPTVVEADNETEMPSNAALNGMIPEGTIYTFTPDNLGINEDEAIEITLYPNPASQYLYIQRNENGGQEYRAIIYNSVGQKVKSVTTKKNTLNISSLSSGIFFIRLEMEHGNTTRKFVKI